MIDELFEDKAPKAAKPLGFKGYGSTPHLTGSRVGPADWHIETGQASILTEKTRDEYDRIIVTEKLDGSCVAVANMSGVLVPVNRPGYHVTDSPHRMHQLLVPWVEARRKKLLDILDDGERVAAEWLLQAHGTRYEIKDADELFVGFAILRGKNRLPHDEARSRFAAAGILGAAVISDGPPLSQAAAMDVLGLLGRHNAVDPVEGAVWVCERKGRFEFIAKHVVADKLDGTYLPVETGGGDVWNYDPDLLAS